MQLATEAPRFEAESLTLDADRAALAPQDSRAANNTRRIAAYVLAYQFSRGKLPESAQPVLGRLILYMQNGAFDTDTRKAIGAFWNLSDDGDLRNYTGGSRTFGDANFYWALVRAAKARGLDVSVWNTDPNPTQSLYTTFAQKVLPPATYQGYNGQYILSRLSANTKAILGIDGNGNPIATGLNTSTTVPAAPAPTGTSAGGGSKTSTSNAAASFTSAVTSFFGGDTGAENTTPEQASKTLSQKLLVGVAIAVVLAGVVYLVGQFLDKKAA